MGTRYDLRSQDPEPSVYAALPGTMQSDFVPHNLTPMKSALVGREVLGTVLTLRMCWVRLQLILLYRMSPQSVDIRVNQQQLHRMRPVRTSSTYRPG